MPTDLTFDRPLTLVVFLSGAECRACLDESYVWDKLSQLSPNELRVVAVGVNTTKSEVDSMRRSRPSGYDFLTFQSEQDEAGLGIGSVTPLKVLFDKAGNIRLVSGPAAGHAAHEEFFAKVKNEVGTVSHISMSDSPSQPLR